MFSTGIYIIISPTNKIYVGQSRNLVKRKSAYKTGKCQKQSKLFASLNKYGWDVHQFEVIMPLKDGIDQGMLDMWEQLFIDHYRDSGYGLMNLREGGFRGKLSPESLAKLSKAQRERKRKPHTKETCAAISLAKKGRSNGLEGSTLSEYQKSVLLSHNKGVKKNRDAVLKHAIAVSGDNSGMSKLNSTQVRVIHRLLIDGEKRSYICKIFNVKWQTIDSIRRGRSWSQVTGIYHSKRTFILS